MRALAIIVSLFILTACVSVEQSVDMPDELLSAPGNDEALPTPVPTSTPDELDSLLFLDSEMLVQLVQDVRPAVVRVRHGQGTGTGAIFEVDGDTAYILTNEHVIDSSSSISVIVNDRTSYNATVVGKDALRDLAVLKICCGTFKALPMGSTAQVQVGLQVVNIGYALGLPGEATVTTGIISAVRYETREQRWAVQTDAAVNPGNSGGPMLSTTGEILGINTYRIDQNSAGRPAEALGFAVSVETIREQLPVLKGSAPAPTPTPRPQAASTPTPYPGQPTPYPSPTDPAICLGPEFTLEEMLACIDSLPIPTPTSTPTPYPGHPSPTPALECRTGPDATFEELMACLDVTPTPQPQPTSRPLL